MAKLQHFGVWGRAAGGREGRATEIDGEGAVGIVIVVTVVAVGAVVSVLEWHDSRGPQGT